MLVINGDLNMKIRITKVPNAKETSEKSNNTHGGDFSNGIVQVNSGGLHSTNPMEGVPMGIAPDGLPNLVEEGEVIYNDYVFSNRLTVPQSGLEKYKLPKKYKGYTYALAAEKLSKESSERPNDAISKRGLEDSMTKLMMMQEETKDKDQMNNRKTNKFAVGGNIDSLDYYRLYNPKEAFSETIDSMAEKRMSKAPVITVSPEFKLDSFDIPTFTDMSYRNYPAHLTSLLKDTPDNPNNSFNYLLRTPAGVHTSQSSTETGENVSPVQTEDSERATWMRYAPVVGSAIGSITSMFTKPDYEHSNLLFNEINSTSPRYVKAAPVGNYLRYNPINTSYMMNRIGADINSSRRGIVNNSQGNAAAARNSLIALNRSAVDSLGDAFIKATQYNDQLKQSIENFNRQTNMFNSQNALQADATNAKLYESNAERRLKALNNIAAMRETADSQLESARSANITNFLDNLGLVGRENMMMNWRNELLKNGVWGPGAERIVKNGGKLMTKRDRRRK